MYAYIYLDPRNQLEPIYVGKGDRGRAIKHLSCTHIRFSRKLHQITLSGLPIEILTFDAPDEKAAHAYERFWIKIFGRLDQDTGSLCNYTDGGEGSSGYIASEEARRKISEYHTGRKRSPETCLNISVMKKLKITLETRAKMRNAKLEISRTEEQKRKIGAALTGRTCVRSAETKKRMSEAAKRRPKEHYEKIAAGRRKFYADKRAVEVQTIN